MARKRAEAPAIAEARARLVDTSPRADRITLDLAAPPSTNNLYATVPTGRGVGKRVLVKDARLYKAMVVERVHAWGFEERKLPPAPPYELVLHFWPPNRGNYPDMDNLLKLVQDGMFEGFGGKAAGYDDKQVEAGHYERMPPVDPHRSCIRVTLKTRSSGHAL